MYYNRVIYIECPETLCIIVVDNSKLGGLCTALYILNLYIMIVILL